MNFLAWNIYGIANDTTRNMLHRHCQIFKPILLGIFEPRTSFELVPCRFWTSLNLVLCCLNDRPGRSSNIWLFVNPAAVCHILLVSDQCIVINFAMGNFETVIAVVHGAASYVLRRNLWERLSSFRSDRLLFLGDFNAILGAHERRGGLAPQRIACDDFRSFIADLSLVEVPMSGLHFSWSSRRSLGLVESKLDRALVSEGFMGLWSHVAARLLPRCCSDHAP